MKKIIALLICAVMAIPSVFVCADSLLVNTVKINVNEGTVVINDEEIESAAVPYVNESGITMMEFYTIADAMGAAVTEADGVFTVTLEGVSMTYTLDSEYVNIGGQTITMPCKLIRNHYGVVMAPLRFVAEALGADVSYDGETGEIIVMSSGGMDEGINFQLLFKYAGKTKIGHSKEHWRFAKSDNFDMSTGYGNEYMFAMDDISISLYTVKNTDEFTADQVYIMMQQEGYSYQRYVVYEKGIKDHKGIKCVYVKKRYVDSITEEYCFVTDEYLYNITIDRSFETFAGAKNDADVNAFIESLEFDYYGGDEENTVDIATVDFDITDGEEVKDEYVDGNYSWSIKLNDTWEVNEYYGFYNKVTITRPAGYEEEDEDDDMDYMYESLDMEVDPVVTIAVYSNPENQSPSDWANQEHKLLSQTVNPEYCTISPVRDYMVNGLKAKVFEALETEGESEFISKYYYMNYEGYRYSISLYYNKKEEDVSGFLSSADALIQSFTPGKINAEEVGDALMADSDISALSITKEYSDDRLTLSYPCLWEADATETGIYISPYGSGSSSYDIIDMLLPQFSLLMLGSDGIGVMVKDTPLKYYKDDLTLASYTVEEYMKKNIAQILNMSGNMVSVKLESGIEETQIMGVRGYRADIVIEAEGMEVYYTLYGVPQAEDSFISITKVCESILKNTVYDNAAEEIVKSIKLNN